MKKKFLILAICSLESLVLIAGCYWYYQKSFQHLRFGVEKVAVLDQEQFIPTADEELDFYYELASNSSYSEQPEWLKKKATYTYNADGLNDRFNYSVEKKPNTFRIVTLGDSFTFGHYVSTTENWTETLENLLNARESKCSIAKFEVINLGVPGFDIPYIVNRYIKNGTKYQPDLVVWLESGSGFDRLNEVMQPLIKQCKATELGIAATKSADPKDYHYCWRSAQEKVWQDFSKMKAAQYLTPYWDKFFGHSTQQEVRYYTFENYADKYAFDFWKTKYANFAQFLSIITPMWDKQDLILPDGHPNTKGHQVIAQDIYEDLTKTTLKECFSDN